MGKQCHRVLRALRRHPEGICQVEFLLPNVIDGGHPITRLAARIKDLRDQGHEIEVAGERYSCAVYKLVEASAPSAPEITAPVARESNPELEPEPALFELPVRNAIYGDEAA